MQLLIAFFAFLASSGYVLFLDHILLSPRSLQKVLVIPIVFMVVVCYYFAKNSWRIITHPYDKWLLLFGGAALVQLLIVSTGGFQSPFLILIHIFMIALSFLFSFAISVVFLLFAFVTIFVDMSFYQNVIELLLTHPTVILLQVVSLLSIIPLAYLISQQYHAREIVSALLKRKVNRDEAIFSNLSEMVIVTDADFRILSVNDAAAKTLQRSRAELLDTPLFDILLLKDPQNKLATKETFANKIVNGQFILMRSPIPQRNVTVHAQQIHNREDDTNEISFIITYLHTTADPLAVTLDKARAKYETLIRNIKRQLLAKKLIHTQSDLLLLEKIENDTYILQTMPQLQAAQMLERIDIAQLCKQTVLLNQDFAKGLGVTTSFALTNFGMHDIAPLTVKNYPVKPEQLTGPFFTAECDSKKIELLVGKILDLAVFLASSTKKHSVAVTTERGKELVTVSITASSPDIKEKDLTELFVPYYGRLDSKANLRSSSGLEGVIIKQLADSLGITLETKRGTLATPSLSFTIHIPKKVVQKSL